MPSGARVGSATLCWPSSMNGLAAGPSWAFLDRVQELVLAPAHVDGAGAGHRRVRPRDRAVERPVDLHRRRAGAVAAQQRVGTSRQVGHARQRLRHHVGDDESARRTRSSALDAADPAAAVSDPRHARVGVDLAAERLAVGDERVRQPFGAAPRGRPADGVPEQVQIERGDRRAGAVRRRVAVHRGAVEPGARVRSRRTGACRARRRCRAASARSRAACSGPAPPSSLTGPPSGGKPVSIVARTASKLSRNGLGELRPVPADARRRCGRGRGRGTSRRHRAAGARRPASGCTHSRPCSASGIRLHTGDADRRRIDRREGVVVEAGQRQLLGAHRPAGRVRGLQDQHLAPRLGEPDGGREPVRPGPDDDRVASRHRARAIWRIMLRSSSAPQNACWASEPAVL